jgi:hypothetical protein
VTANLVIGVVGLKKVKFESILFLYTKMFETIALDEFQ